MNDKQKNRQVKNQYMKTVETHLDTVRRLCMYVYVYLFAIN